MLKIPVKHHVIGVPEHEEKISEFVSDLSKNFYDVRSEIVPYKEFANGETLVQLQESVRGKYVHVPLFLDPKNKNPSDNFNNLVIHHLLMRQCALTHGAKGVSIDSIPFYDIERKVNIKASSSVPMLTGMESSARDVIMYFKEQQRMFPQKSEQIHLVGTQDTLHFVNNMQRYLIEVLGSHAVSSEISLYQEDELGLTTVSFENPLDQKHVYVVSDVNGSVSTNRFLTYNDRLIQTLLLADRANKFGAKTVNLVPTCFPYSRQDKPTQGGLKERVTREPSSAQFMVDLMQHFLEVDYCLTMDIHNPAIINNSNQSKFVNLYTGRKVNAVVNILKQNGKENIVLCPMDEGGLKKLSSISKDIGVNYLTVIKHRPDSKKNTVDEISVYGDVKDKDILIHDDILDTASSLVKLIQKLHQLGARSITVSVTHGMFNKDIKNNKDAIRDLTELYAKGCFEKIYITNSVYRDMTFYPPFVEIIDAAKNFADPIKSIYLGDQINYNFGASVV